MDVPPSIPAPLPSAPHSPILTRLLSSSSPSRLRLRLHPTPPPSLLSVAVPCPDPLPRIRSTVAPPNARSHCFSRRNSASSSPPQPQTNQHYDKPLFPSSATRIFVKGLSCSTPAGLLVKTFSQFGDVCRVKIIVSKNTKQSLGLAYVWFTCAENAKSAMEEMDGKFVDGRFISVTMAKPECPTRQVRPRHFQLQPE